MPIRIDSAIREAGDRKNSLRYSITNVAGEQINRVEMQMWLTSDSAGGRTTRQFSLDDCKLAPGAKIESSQDLDKDMRGATRMLFIVLLAQSDDTLWFVDVADNYRLQKEIDGLAHDSMPDLSCCSATRKSRRPEIQSSLTFEPLTRNPVSNPSVDTVPIQLDSPRPNYTMEALKYKVEGVVKLRVLVGVDGEVKQVMVISGLPDGLDEEAIRSAHSIRFQPAKKNGQPVAFWEPVDIEFHLP
jgi:TonB family protein